MGKRERRTFTEEFKQEAVRLTETSGRGKSMRSRLIGQAKKEFPVHRLCNVLGVSESGYFAWKGRPASRRQGEDMVLLAHIRAQFSTSNETGACPGPDPGARRACMPNLPRKGLPSGGIVWPG